MPKTKRFVKMNWRKRYEETVSSIDIQPNVGMRVRSLKPIDGNFEIVGKEGIIDNVSSDIVAVEYDTMRWIGSIYEWNDGYYMVLSK